MFEWIIKVIGLTSFINWLRPAFQDEKGDASFRRITPFVLTGAGVYMIISDKIPVSDRLSAFYAMLLAAAFYAGLITFQNVYSIYTAWKGGGGTLPSIPTSLENQVSSIQGMIPKAE